MIDKVLQARLRPPIVFADDEDEGVRRADLASEILHRLRRRTLGIFLVHPVEHRQADLLGVDQLGGRAAGAKLRRDEARHADPDACGAVGAVENQHVIRHLALHGELPRRTPRRPKTINGRN